MQGSRFVLFFSMFCTGVFTLLLSTLTSANSWSNYRGVERKPDKPQQQFYRAPHSYPSMNRPYPVYPQQNVVTIIYQQSLPTVTQYQSTSYGFVNGEHGTIESTQYTLIADWRRYGLPDPQVGMHWIYQNGRYVQIPNER